MQDYVEHKDTIDVPRGTGTEGFLRALGEILKLPRVQEVKVDARGKVSYVRYLYPGEQVKPIEVDFETLMPYGILRNTKLVELQVHSINDALKIMAIMFMAAGRDRLVPLGLVGGANTVFFDWYKESTGLVLDPEGESAYGLPFYRDHKVEDYMLFLAAGYSRQGKLLDTQKAYKVVMPQRVEQVDGATKAPDEVKIIP